MKLRKLLSLVLAAVMFLGCMTVTAFADAQNEITLDQTAVTLVVGDTKTLTPTVILEEENVTSWISELVQWSSTEETVATVDKGVVTAVKPGMTTITAECEGYSATCIVTVISGTATLDLDSNSSKEIDQNYTLTQDGDTTYTDVTKVKLEWTITDITATYTSNKTWDTDSLTWKETKSVDEIANKTAEFTLTNYSSKKVIGTVSFKVEDTLEDTLTSATFDDNNGKTIDTVVNSDHTIDETKKTNVPSNKITATLKFNADKFAELSATTAATKYGTYTVTISAASTKQDQTAPAALNKDNATVTSTSVTLEAVSAGKSDTKYGYSTSNDATTVTNWQDSVEFTGLTASTTYYFFAKYVGNDDYNEAISTGTEIKTSAAWKSLSATITTTTGEEIVYYHPVLGGTNPQPDKFAYSTDGGKTFTEISKPDGGYTMLDVATYAKQGQLYYQGGSVYTVRSVNNISWNDTFADNSYYDYPYHAATDYDDLQGGIKAKIATDVSETVEKLCANEVTPEKYSTNNTPTFNGVSLSDIANAYSYGLTDFGGNGCIFWSCVVTESRYSFCFNDEWIDCNRTSIVPCVLISRTFN